jgi:hypothetical protein
VSDRITDVADNDEFLAEDTFPEEAEIGATEEFVFEYEDDKEESEEEEEEKEEEEEEVFFDEVFDKDEAGV